MYTLQALILQTNEKLIASSFGLESVALPCGLYLIPFTYDYVNAKGISFLPLTDEGLSDIGTDLKNICLSLSKNGKAAYVEAEFHGGTGTQACMLFESGNIVELAQENESAINYALKWLGISNHGSQDEFSVAGLGMQRDTAGWLNA
jgi:hypothetical protein